MENKFFLQAFDGERDGKIEVLMDSDKETIVVRTPEGYGYRVPKKELRVLVDIMNTMDLNREG